MCRCHRRANHPQWRTSRHVPHPEERHAGQGTPTSGQFSRWGPAPRGSAKPAPMTLRHANVGPHPLPTLDGDRSPLPLPGAAPFSCPAGCRGGPDHGRFSRRGPAPRPDGAAKPRTAVTPHGSAGEETPPVAVRMQARRDASSPDCAPTPERRPVLPVGAFTPAPPRAAGQEGVLPSSAMAQVSARTPPGRAARRPGNADLRSAPRGSAKPAPMTLRHANVSSPPSPNPGCCDRSPLPLPRGPTEPRNRTDPISLEDCQIFRV